MLGLPVAGPASQILKIANTGTIRSPLQLMVHRHTHTNRYELVIVLRHLAYLEAGPWTLVGLLVGLTQRGHANANESLSSSLGLMNSSVVLLDIQRLKGKASPVPFTDHSHFSALPLHPIMGPISQVVTSLVCEVIWRDGPLSHWVCAFLKLWGWGFPGTVLEETGWRAHI